ncbi:AAA family ATPase [Methanospirillum sp.]
MERRIPYGICNYQEAILKKAYLIDKTSYIQKLETIQNPVFLRPRRFGKSLFCSMLQYYYDRSYVPRSADPFVKFN